MITDKYLRDVEDFIYRCKTLLQECAGYTQAIKDMDTRGEDIEFLIKDKNTVATTVSYNHLMKQAYISILEKELRRAERELNHLRLPPLPPRYSTRKQELFSRIPGDVLLSADWKQFVKETEAEGHGINCWKRFKNAEALEHEFASYRTARPRTVVMRDK